MWSCGGKSEVEKVIGGCIAHGKSDYGVEIGLSSKGYGEGLKHSQKKGSYPTATVERER